MIDNVKNWTRLATRLAATKEAAMPMRSIVATMTRKKPE